MQIEDGIYNALCNMQTFANDDDKQISATSLQASANNTSKNRMLVQIVWNSRNNEHIFLQS